MNIIYGGSFNPPTIAHYKIAKRVLEVFPNSKLIFLPTSLYYNKPNLASNVDRVNMLKIMCKYLKNRADVSTYELDSDKFMGTYYTLKQFDDCCFLMGADNFDYLDKWIMFDKLVSENKFLILPREGFDVEKKISENEVLRKNRNNFFILSDFDKLDISSSLYRDKKDKNLLLDEVEKYIKENQLYNN